MSQLFVHRPGTTVLHRLPGGAKLAGLAVASIVVAAVPGPVSALVALAVALGLLAWSRTGWGAAFRTLRGLLLVLVLLAAIQVWQSGWARAVETVADLQMRRFTATAVRGDVMDRGVWSWSRHPNYLGELGFWVSMALFGVAAAPGDWWWLVLGAVGIWAMLSFASIPMMEDRSLERRPEYQRVIDRVARFFPRPPRRTAA